MPDRDIDSISDHIQCITIQQQKLTEQITELQHKLRCIKRHKRPIEVGNRVRVKTHQNINQILARSLVLLQQNCLQGSN